MAESTGLLKFPPGFKIGFSTACYQIEGAWDADGKGENIWDRFAHTQSSRIADGSSGDVACDSYKHYKQDVALIKAMGGQIYRFSISWSRLLPTGFANMVNPAGLDYYNNLIDELIVNGIEPMVTLFHWDLPQPLQEIGGWTNEKLIDYFTDYARIAYSNFGDRVKKWITFNEPWEMCYLGYGYGLFPPGVPGLGVNEYLAGHTVLKAHAKAYHIYHNEFQNASSPGSVGISMNTTFHLPKTDDPADVEATDRYYDFHVGWFAHPIFSKEGDYPQTMKLAVAANSKAEGFPTSRLPEFDTDWIDLIRGSADFYGMNHYTSQLVSASDPADLGIEPSWRRDLAAVSSQDPAWPKTASFWFRVVPHGIRGALKKVKALYNSPVVYITENGFSDKGGINDDGRVSYFNSYLKEILKAIYIDEVNIELYTAWALLDDFEWTAGYTERFGIVHVDFNDPDRKRTPKKSAEYFKRILKNRAVDE